MTVPPPSRPQRPRRVTPPQPTVAKTELARDRILASAIDQISDAGLRRFTVDGLARRVGLSRVTIYRHFVSREGVLEAALLRELRELTDQVDAAVRRHDGLERRIVEAFVVTILALREHAALQRLLRSDPELILPLLSTGGGPVIETGRQFIAALARDQAAAGAAPLPGPQLEILAELIARMILSFVLTPESVVPLGSESELRAFAEPTIGAIVRGIALTARGTRPDGRR